ncbi:MAG: hypothetical protein JW753_02435 [Dehalococcoidia bacterium]|nr:hypothetical protein [Dehalococcoidia bacterium]
MPTWAKVLSLPAMISVVVLSVVLAGRGSITPDRGSTTPDRSSIPNPGVTIGAEYGEPHAMVVNSGHVPPETTPQIDGVLATGEWGVPAFTLDFKVYETPAATASSYYRVEIGTGEARGYLVNDNASLYIAIVLTLDGPTRGFWDETGMDFNIGFLLYADGSEVPDDVRWIVWQFDKDWDTNQGLGFDRHWNINYGASGAYDDCENGVRAASHDEGEDVYCYESRIPLSSGDTQDLAVVAGDTIGLQVCLWHRSRVTYQFYQGVTWPAKDWPVPYSYAKIVLASGP